MGEPIRFLLNGELTTVDPVDPTMTLLDWLRGEAHKTGTKEGCREGDCGACTVVMGRVEDGALRLYPVNSCLVLLPAVDGRLVVTVEGLADGDVLHAVQQALIKRHGSQCGFCTPGMAMSLMAFQHNGGDIHEALGGNLCRCTGYRPIVEAADDIAATPPNDRYAREGDALARRLESLARGETLTVTKDDCRYFAPVSMEALLKLAAENAEANYVAGGTDLGLLVTKLYQKPKTIIAVDRVPELRRLTETADELAIGGGVTYAEAIPALDRLAPALGALARRVGSRQIRSLGTLAGNLANASPIGDFIPPLLALGASVNLRSASGARAVAVSDFILDYRRTALVPGEIIEGITIPRLGRDTTFYAYKLTKRYEEDISTVSLSVALTLQKGRVAAIRAAFGGVAKTAVRAYRLEAALDGAFWSMPALEAALPALAEDIHPINDARGSAEYRRMAAEGLLRRCLIESQNPGQSLEVMAL